MHNPVSMYVTRGLCTHTHTRACTFPEFPLTSHTHTHTRTHTHTHTHTRTHTRTRTHTHTHTHTHAHTHTHTHTRTHARTHTHTHTHTHTLAHSLTHTRTRTHTHTHPHTHHNVTLFYILLHRFTSPLHHHYKTAGTFAHNDSTITSLRPKLKSYKHMQTMNINTVYTHTLPAVYITTREIIETSGNR